VTAAPSRSLPPPPPPPPSGFRFRAPRTVRLRLTLLYVGLFLASAACLLVITYFLVARQLPGTVTLRTSGGGTGVPFIWLAGSIFPWERELAGLEVCCEPVLQVGEVASNPQIAARGLISTTTTGVEVRPAVPVRSDWRRLDPPGLGEHTAEILSELGVDGPALESLKKDGVV